MVAVMDGEIGAFADQAHIQRFVDETQGGRGVFLHHFVRNAIRIDERADFLLVQLHQQLRQGRKRLQVAKGFRAVTVRPFRCSALHDAHRSDVFGRLAVGVVVEFLERRE